MWGINGACGSEFACYRCINVFFLPNFFFSLPPHAHTSVPMTFYYGVYDFMMHTTQEALPVLEDRILNELQFIPMQRKHVPPPTTPFICPSLSRYIPNLISLWGNHPTYSRTDTYPRTFSLSQVTTPDVDHVISQMTNPDHIRSIGFSEYKNGKFPLYSINLISTLCM
jgi:hypothetical protein